MQVSPFTNDTFTQNEAKTKVDCGNQCEQKFFTSSSTQYSISDFNHGNDDNSIWISELDETFVCTSDTTSSASDYNVSNFEYTDTLRKPRTDAFIAFWEALHTLFQRCITCGKPSKVTKLFIITSALIVNFTCARQHKNTWRPQKLINRYFNGNITFATSVLFSANTFQKIQKYFRLAKVAFISESSYYEIQKNFLFPVVDEAWLCEQKNLLNETRNKGGRALSGGGRCNSLGHNAKYLTYPF